MKRPRIRTPEHASASERACVRAQRSYGHARARTKADGTLLCARASRSLAQSTLVGLLTVSAHGARERERGDHAGVCLGNTRPWSPRRCPCTWRPSSRLLGSSTRLRCDQRPHPVSKYAEPLPCKAASCIQHGTHEVPTYDTDDRCRVHPATRTARARRKTASGRKATGWDLRTGEATSAHGLR